MNINKMLYYVVYRNNVGNKL